MNKTDINIIRSNRRTLSVEVAGNGSVTVRAPRRASERDIRRFIDERAAWIEEKSSLRRAEYEAAKKLDPIDEASLRSRAAAVLPQRVAFYAAVLGVTPGKITVRMQKTRWGSCSADKNLSFNCLLMLMPDPIIDYVVVHELCHILHHDHSRAFWAEVARIMPDYAEKRRLLRETGGVLMARANLV